MLISVAEDKRCRINRKNMQGDIHLPMLENGRDSARAATRYDHSGCVFTAAERGGAQYIYSWRNRCLFAMATS